MPVIKVQTAVFSAAKFSERVCNVVDPGQGNILKVQIPTADPAAAAKSLISMGAEARYVRQLSNAVRINAVAGSDLANMFTLNPIEERTVESVDRGTREFMHEVVSCELTKIGAARNKIITKKKRAKTRADNKAAKLAAAAAEIQAEVLA